MVPRGADAVMMIEHTEARQSEGKTLIEIRRAATSGQFIAFAGSDLARGETVLRAGQHLTSREIGMLAAVGRAKVEVYRKPSVAIISTGDEIVAPGERSCRARSMIRTRRFSPRRSRKPAARRACSASAPMTRCGCCG